MKEDLEKEKWGKGTGEEDDAVEGVNAERIERMK